MRWAQRALAGLALAAMLLAAAPVAAAADLGDQVVRVLVTYQKWDSARPWAKKAPRTRSGFGVVVPGDSLLTTAGLVKDAIMIRVSKHGQPQRISARIVHQDPAINLARLAVDEPGFFADLRPVRLARQLPTTGEVRTARWKNRQLEVAAGRVARITVEHGANGTLRHAFLFVTTDLADGGSGEPVFRRDRFLGLVVAQQETEARVLPVEVIRAYLDASRDPTSYPGFASLRLSWQVNRDATLARYLSLKGEPRGVVITEVPWGSSACGPLRPGDVLLALDGHALNAEGYYRHPRYGQLLFPHLAIANHLAGDTITARVLRDGREEKIELALRTYPNAGRLVPGPQHDRPPPYLVAGGLVFRELDRDYLLTWGKGWRASANQRLVTYWDLERDAQTPARRRLIVLSQVLPDPYNIGYHDERNLVVERVNGRPVGSLSALVEALQHPQGGVQRLEFLPNETRAQIVLDAGELDAATARILGAYNIPAAYRAPASPPPDLGPECPPSR